MDNNLPQAFSDKATELKTEDKKEPTKKQQAIVFLAITSFVFLALSGFLIYRNNLLKRRLNEVPSKAIIKDGETVSEEKPQPTHFRMSRRCSTKECLFTDGKWPEGFARVQGYYLQYEDSSSRGGLDSVCDGFVVTGGNETVIGFTNDLIESGNSVNRKIDGKLVLTISIEGLNEKMRRLITSSDQNNQIELGIMMLTPKGREVNVCEPLVGIISANSLLASDEDLE